MAQTAGALPKIEVIYKDIQHGELGSTTIEGETMLELGM